MAYEFTRKTDNVDDVMAVDVNELQQALEAHEFLTLKAATELTIASGVITAVQASHKLQPESSTADDLDTINGMDEGDILVLYVSDPGTDTITIKHGTGNISCVGGDDIALSEGAVICYFDGTTVFVSGGGGGGGGGTVSPQLCNGRLTLESGVPVSTSNQADKTNLYFTPYNGNEISLYNGTNWIRHTFTELTLALGALTASKPHDIFIYDNAGTLTLSATEWTDATTRATALATQDGVYVKSGATGYRYLGTIYMDAASKCQDTEAHRYMFNYYNKVSRMSYFQDTTLHTYATAEYRYWNNSADNKIDFVIGIVEEELNVFVNAIVTAGEAGKNSVVSCHMDSAGGSTLFAIIASTTNTVAGSSTRRINSSAGYHSVYITEYQAGGVAGTYSQAAVKLITYG